MKTWTATGQEAKYVNVKDVQVGDKIEVYMGGGKDAIEGRVTEIERNASGFVVTIDNNQKWDAGFVRCCTVMS